MNRRFACQTIGTGRAARLCGLPMFDMSADDRRQLETWPRIEGHVSRHALEFYD